MNKKIAIFPAALLFFVILLISSAVSSMALAGQKKTAAGDEHPLYERFYGWILALLYAPIAFFGLGDHTAPESYYVGEYDTAVIFRIPEGENLSSLRFFAGINTGDWLLERSDDGVSWVTTAIAEQNYVSVLRWNELKLDAPVSSPLYRLTSMGEALDLGELALYDHSGNLLTPSEVPTAAEALFDEQETVPPRISYLNGSYFDEIYHVRTAWEYLRCDGVYEWTHPPLGKEILSLGLLIFGVNPFGWRFMGTLCGVLMLPLLYAFLQKLWGRWSVSCACTAIFALDFMHFTQTRLATIDTYSVLFILGMYYYMYRFCSEEERKERNLLLSGLFFGLGAAAKWTCLYAGAGLAVIWLCYWLRRKEAFRTKNFWRNVGLCLGCFVALPALIYYISYLPYGKTAGLRGAGMFFTPQYLHMVLDNQSAMWNYHSALVATHPYSSVWWQWMVDARPILYYLEYSGGDKSIIAAFTGPLLCWAGLGSLGLCAAGGVFRRDVRPVFVLLGYLAQMLPWMLVTRLTFAYHYFPSEIFLTLALGYVLSVIEESRGDRLWTWSSAAAAAALFAAFYPAISGAMCAQSRFEWLHWFPSWPL